MVPANFQTEVAAFAARHVAPLADLNTREDFPHELWARMAEARLHGLYVAEAYGGLGGDSLALMEAGEAFVHAGGNMGMAAAWFSHSVVAHFLIERFGSAEQKQRLLPELAAGRLTAAVAISEPGAGAHPKHLETRASREDGGFVLTGEKAYITNGPIAGLFVVVAVSGSKDGRKRFTALLVPRETPGLTVRPMPALDYLRPAQHARLELKACRVPAGAVLGEPGRAFETMAKPLRDVEDVLKMGRVLGGLRRQLDELALALRRRAARADLPLREALGALAVQYTALRVLSHRAAAMLDEGPPGTELAQVSLALREQARQFCAALARIRESSGAGEGGAPSPLDRELQRAVDMPRKVDLIKHAKIGDALLCEGL